MKLSKKISAALALMTALSIFASGCSDKEENKEPVTPNVITSAAPSDDGAGSAGSPAAPAQTQVVTDSEGNAATGEDGSVLTEVVAPAADSQGTEAPTLPDEIADLITATTPKATAVAVVDPSLDSATRYSYNTLDANEKALYDAILDSATKLQSKIMVSDAVTLEVWAKIFGMVYNQEPQLFWLNSKLKVGRLYFNETDPDKISAMQKEIDASADKLVKEAAGKSSTYEKLKLFHDYLVFNSTFEKSGEVGNYNVSIYNAFKGGTSSQGDIQCAGYAKAMLYLCDKAGIDCMVIVGTNDKGLSHAWNKVKVEGEWYNLDCTWDDPILSTPVYNYIRYNNFLVPDSWINEKTHFNINKMDLSGGGKITYFDPPKATATAQNYFIKNGYVYNDTSSAEAAIKKALDETSAAGMTVAEIMVGSKDVYSTLTSSANLKSYQDYIKGKNSKIKGISDNSNPNMLVVQLDIKYN